MCGIAGIISPQSQEIERQKIVQMTDLMLHRGPDSSGVYSGDHFSFGHRRLSIIDLSEHGTQPMVWRDKYVITYNGEIYNYLEIQKTLSEKGYHFETSTDTEVILAAYDFWGESCVDQFNGMWAFAIYDRSKHKIFASRDRFGIKPFYYSVINGEFVFASEIKPILSHMDNIKANKSIIADYLTLGYEDHTNQTFFDGVFKLSGSHNLIYDLGSFEYEITRYYDINLEISKKTSGSENSKSDKNKFESWGNSLERSIRLRLRSDVKVGTCLSGGLDSSSIASIAAREFKNQSDIKFTAIHAKSDQSDESMFAKDVSTHSGLDLQTITPTEEEFFDNIENVVRVQEEPFGGPSIFMQYFVMKKAKDLGLKVLLDGQGGDETLLGYERYFPASIMRSGPINFAKELLASRKNSRLSSYQVIAYLLYFKSSRVRFFKIKRSSKFLKKSVFKLVNRDVLKKNAKSYSKILDLQKHEIFNTQLPHLLRYEDKNSMNFSVETRLPFIDYRLLEGSLSLDFSDKIQNGWTKFALRKSVESFLPRHVVWRKNKFGFEAPDRLWLKRVRQDLAVKLSSSQLLKEFLKDQINIDRLSNKQVWKLYNLAVWEKIFNVKT